MCLPHTTTKCVMLDEGGCVMIVCVGMRGCVCLETDRSKKKKHQKYALSVCDGRSGRRSNKSKSFINEKVFEEKEREREIGADVRIQLGSPGNNMRGFWE